MASTRKRKRSVDADNQTQELPISSSSSSSTMPSTSTHSTSAMSSAMPSSLSSSAATESKEEKEANGREEKHNTSVAQRTSDSLPGPLHNIILGYAGFPELPNMTAGSFSLFHSIKKAKTIKLMKLFTAIVSGEPATVNTMIDEDPSLLFERLEEKESITSLSGQKSNNVTAYRTALAVEDTEIAALIKNKMIEQQAGELADQQYREQFPTGWEAAEEKRWAPVFTQLATLTDAIKDAKAGDITSTRDLDYKLTVREGSAVALALTQFRLQLDAKLNETITTGRHCNPHLLLQAYRIYDRHYEDYFGSDRENPRALLFWQRVIGGIQRGLPVNYVQAICDGLDLTAVNLRDNSPQGRSLTIELFDTSQRKWVPHDFYPLAGSLLGFEYALGAGCWAGTWAWNAGDRGESGSFEAYTYQKQRLARDLCTSAALENLQRLAW